jgi:hypothetical protein
MPVIDHDPFPALRESILAVLRTHPAGLSEYEFLRALRHAGVRPFDRLQLNQPMGLYCSHFLLFHCLYRLQEELRAQGEDLRIDCLRIRVGRLSRTPLGTMGAPDPLRAYYLDLRQLQRVGEEEVARLLGGFWVRYRGDDRREQALRVLGLADPVSGEEIKLQYRRLVMRHHPDRGGDKEMLQALNAAMDVLA